MIKNLNKPTYIFCKNYSEFLQYKDENPDITNCQYIVDQYSLFGRFPGEIIRFGDYMERWDYLPIEEMIEAVERDWDKINKEEEDKTLQYGIDK